MRRALAAATAVAALAVALPGAAQDLSTYVVAEDGTLLATDIYLSFGSGPWPVVLIRTPYDKTELREVAVALVVLGFAVATQDTRGRFASTGVDTVFRDDAEDGRTTISWIAAQDWCNGRIGTLGGSAFAITGYLAAPGAGPALQSVTALVATPDLYHHAFLQGGALRQDLAYNWLAGQGSLEVYDQVRAHRLKDAWWDPVEVVTRAARVTAAGLHVGGWYDIFGQGTLDAFSTFQARGGRGARGRQYLVMGPWTHGSLGGRDVGELRYPAGAELDPLDLIVPWLNHTLRGWHNEVQDWPPVRVYRMGAVDEQGAPGNDWVELERWPPLARYQPLYLTSDGSLSEELPAVGEIELEMDPSDPVPTLGGANLFPDLEVDGRPMGDGPHDQRPIEGRDDVLEFTSDVLAEPLEVMGRVSAKLWVLPDTPDLDVAVRLTDVYPDGRSMLVLDGIRRARMRCGDQTECLLVPGAPVELAADLWSTAIVFNAGHRVRISVAGTNAPRFEVNPNDGGELGDPDPGVVARPRLLVGQDHPSRLELPVPVPALRPGGRRVSRPEPGSVSRLNLVNAGGP